MKNNEILKNLIIEIYADKNKKKQSFYTILDKASKECKCSISKLYKLCKDNDYYKYDSLKREIYFFQIIKKIRSSNKQKNIEVKKFRNVIKKQIKLIKNLKLKNQSLNNGLPITEPIESSLSL